MSDLLRAALAARANGDHKAAEYLDRQCAALVNNPRAARVMALAAQPDSIAKIDALLKLLGLPSDATTQQVQKAVDHLLSALAPADADPLESDAEPAPPATLAWARLSAADKARAAKRGITTAAQFEAAKKKLSRRA